MELRTLMMRERKVHKGDIIRGKYEVIANIQNLEESPQPLLALTSATRRYLGTQQMLRHNNMS